jgi:hypothetical protein
VDLVLRPADLPKEDAGPPRRRTGAWAGWIGTGALLAGAYVTGTMAYRASKDLDLQLDRFPADQGYVNDLRGDVRTFSLLTDGLLIGAALLGTLSLYLTFRNTGSERRGS